MQMYLGLKEFIVFYLSMLVLFALYMWGKSLFKRLVKAYKENHHDK